MIINIQDSYLTSAEELSSSDSSDRETSSSQNKDELKLKLKGHTFLTKLYKSV